MSVCVYFNMYECLYCGHTCNLVLAHQVNIKCTSFVYMRVIHQLLIISFFLNAQYFLDVMRVISLNSRALEN